MLVVAGATGATGGVSSTVRAALLRAPNGVTGARALATSELEACSELSLPKGARPTPEDQSQEPSESDDGCCA
eukprot:CAMPEP_0181178002 /NCGR_PEP_ID=MMETSP1096-20121128/5483_1 /TAXON_ID=156174 ORGANISM="Chrysochromulina ericina, Strain CCMP281" /NCGR_SAMPLE_ID=MMETSP1096 /ASSEMBLY_ACC=CAM_ASM_000453 /LENGTH=72 /DNA_ID=CAMNT_0023266233 /DNA_START=441 /DNA_END=659 /DNA_ORIENTATION=-